MLRAKSICHRLKKIIIAAIGHGEKSCAERKAKQTSMWNETAIVKSTEQSEELSVYIT